MTPTDPSRRAASRMVLRDDVYELVLDRLLTGSFQPGDRLGIDDLSRQLSVSPTPIREALATLETTGLIQREALRGYRVAPHLTIAQLNCLIDARQAVEPAALRHAMEQPGSFAEDLAHIHARDVELVHQLHLDSQDITADYNSFREYFKADWAFHSTILQGSGNIYLARMGENLGFQVHRLRQAFGRRSIDALDAIAEHQAILTAVRGGRADEAVEAMRIHLEGVRTRSLRDEAPGA